MSCGMSEIPTPITSETLNRIANTSAAVIASPDDGMFVLVCVWTSYDIDRPQGYNSAIASPLFFFSFYRKIGWS